MTPESFAVVFLSSVVGAVVLSILVSFWRSPFTPFQTCLLYFSIFLNRFLWRVSVPGPLPIDDKQGAVLISNHRSSVDPFFFQWLSRRPIHWMVMREAYDQLAFGWFLKGCLTIPAGRGGVDTAATKMAIRLASEGGLVGMLPEGRINMTDDFMMKVRPGAILIALKANVNVLPCYVEGAPYGGQPWSPFFIPARVKVKFGRLIDLSDFFGRERKDGVLEYLTRFCVREIANTAGVDFEPQLAGRRWKPEREELETMVAALGKRK